EKFAQPFLSLYFEPLQPRDALLRGHFNEASRVLTTLRKDAINQRARLEANPEDVNRGVNDALKFILEAQVAFQRAERQAGPGAANDPAVQEARANLENAWKQGRGWLDTLIDGSAAGPLGLEV